MRQGPIEDQIKKILEEASYSPSEQSWQKLQAALQQNKPAATPVIAKKKVMLFQPLRWAAAAAVLGLLGYGIHYSLRTENQLAMQMPQQIEAMESVSAPIQKNIQQVNAPNLSNVYALGNRNSGYQSNLKIVKGANELTQVFSNENLSLIGIKNMPLSCISNGSVKGICNDNIINALASIEPIEYKSNKSVFLGNFSTVYQADYTSDMGDMHQYVDPFLYSVGVNVGLPTVGVFQAGANLNIRKDIGTKLFVEMGIEGAVTDVQEEKALYYKRNIAGGYNNIGDNGNEKGLTLADADGKTTNTYSNKVWSIGIAPTVGVKVAPKVTVAVGGDLCRNFNNSLVLKENEFVQNTNLSGTENPLKWVNTWDAGAKAKVSYKLNDRIDITGQYRKGLVNYMLSSTGEKIKNSIVSLGMQVNLNP